MPLFAALSRLSTYGWISCACIATLVLIGVRSVRLWYRLRHIPGPSSAGWSLWWQLDRALSGKYHEHLKAVADEYGPLVRIGPNQLLCADPEVIRQMSSARSEYTKAAFYESGRVVPGVDNVVSIRSEAKHKAMRAQMAPAFTVTNDQTYGFEGGIDRQLLSFLALIDSKYLSDKTRSKPFDMAEKTQFYALDVIGDISVGKPFGYLAEDKDLYDYNQINITTLPVMNIVSVFPWLTKIVHKWPFSLALPKEGDDVGFGRLMGFIRGFVEDRIASQPSKAKDMMQISIDNGMAKTDLIQQGFISIIAGSNSTAHTLRMILLSLMTTPKVCEALLQEIRQVSDSVSLPISWAQTQTLPYLQAVVLEGLRMWPPIGGLGFKQVPPQGDTINGYYVPGGTEIGQGFFAVGRSKQIWGQDADIFRPERWLSVGDAELRAMRNAVDTVFGHGKYACLGKPIAMMELHKGVFELIRHFDMSVVNPENPIKTQTSVFVFASDFWVTAARRELS